MYSSSFSVKMKVQLIILVILKQICHTFEETMQEGMSESKNTNKGKLKELDFEIYISSLILLIKFFCENEGPIDYFGDSQTNLPYIW